VISAIGHLIDKVEILIADQSAPAVEFIFFMHLTATRCDEFLGKKRKDFSDGKLPNKAYSPG
jgi:hypothetical protein